MDHRSVRKRSFLLLLALVGHSGCARTPGPADAPLLQAVAPRLARLQAIDVVTAGAVRTLGANEPLQYGDRFALHVETRAPAFLYVTHIHEGQAAALLASSSPESLGTTRMPVADEWLQVPVLAAGDRLCVLVSRERLGILPGSCDDEDDPESPRGPPRPPRPPPPPPTKGNYERRSAPVQHVRLPSM